MTEASPEGWEFVRLGQITSKVGSGSTPRGGSESYQQVGIPLIRSMNVRFEGFKKEGLAFLNQRQAEVRSTGQERR
jgi:type I restriction enzyme S subunit